MNMMDNFSEGVIAEIKERGISPRPFAYFFLRRSVFWTFASFSIIFGAVALAVAHFVFFDNEEIASETLMASQLKWILDGTPLLWLLLFGIFVVCAFISLKKTRVGYRYDTAVSIGWVVGITIVLGLILISLDFGDGIYTYMTSHLSFFEAVKESSDDLPWSF